MVRWQPLSRDKADTLLLLVACVLVLAPHALHVAPWIMAASFALLAWRGWITLRGNRMPPRWVLGPVALLTMPGVYLTYQTYFGRDAGVALLVLLLSCKLLEMRARRDLFVVVCLCFFLMLTNLFYSQSIGTALLMIAATVAILTTQLSFQYTGTVPPLKRRLQMVCKIVGLAAPLTLVLFFLFPRIQGPLWGLPGDAQSSRSGMSETMAPGNIAKLALSDEIAFRASFSTPLPARAALYWRGVVLGNYDGRTWSRLANPTHAARRVSIHANSAPVRYQVTLEPSGQRWLYALDVPQTIPEIADNPAAVNADLQLLATRLITQRIRYDAVSVVDYDLQLDADPIGLQDWLDLPPGFNPKTHAYAAELRTQSDDNATLIKSVLTLFREQPYRYTLEPPRLGRNAVDDFLFGTRAGFCEHYASAFVVLMRALDIPARVVTGYQGGQVNPVDGFLTVRQSDAHAWAEVWLQGRGWVRIDPTAAVAPERIERNGSPQRLPSEFAGLLQLDLSEHGWIAGLNLRIEALGNGWNQWVLNYTPSRQKSLIESLGIDHVDSSVLTLLMLGAGSLIMSIIGGALLWKRTKVDPLAALYRRFCADMERHGMTRAPHEGPRTYAERLTAPSSRLPARRHSTIARFMALYETAVYDRHGVATSASQRKRMIRRLKHLLTEAK